MRTFDVHKQRHMWRPDSRIWTKNTHAVMQMTCKCILSKWKRKKSLFCKGTFDRRPLFYLSCTESVDNTKKKYMKLSPLHCPNTKEENLRIRTYRTSEAHIILLYDVLRLYEHFIMINWYNGISSSTIALNRISRVSNAHETKLTASYWILCVRYNGKIGEGSDRNTFNDMILWENKKILFVWMEPADILNLCHQHLCWNVSVMIAFDCCVVQMDYRTTW